MKLSLLTLAVFYFPTKAHAGEAQGPFGDFGGLIAPEGGNGEGAGSGKDSRHESLGDSQATGSLLDVSGPAALRHVDEQGNSDSSADLAPPGAAFQQPNQAPYSNILTTNSTGAVEGTGMIVDVNAPEVGREGHNEEARKKGGAMGDSLSVFNPLLPSFLRPLVGDDGSAAEDDLIGERPQAAQRLGADGLSDGDVLGLLPSESNALKNSDSAPFANAAQGGMVADGDSDSGFESASDSGSGLEGNPFNGIFSYFRPQVPLSPRNPDANGLFPTGDGSHSFDAPLPLKKEAAQPAGEGAVNAVRTSGEMQQVDNADSSLLSPSALPSALHHSNESTASADEGKEAANDGKENEGDLGLGLMTGAIPYNASSAGNATDAVGMTEATGGSAGGVEGAVLDNVYGPRGAAGGGVKAGAAEAVVFEQPWTEKEGETTTQAQKKGETVGTSVAAAGAGVVALGGGIAIYRKRASNRRRDEELRSSYSARYLHV